MKQKIVSVCSKFNPDVDIDLDLSDELSTFESEGWSVKQISSSVYFKPHGTDMNLQHVLVLFLLERKE